jgi:hypothetical protein
MVRKKLGLQEKAEYNRKLITDNKVVWEKVEQADPRTGEAWVTVVYFEQPFYCIEKGCQRKTRKTRRLDLCAIIGTQLGIKGSGVFYQPLCQKHYIKISTYAKALVAQENAKQDKGL